MNRAQMIEKAQRVLGCPGPTARDCDHHVSAQAVVDALLPQVTTVEELGKLDSRTVLVTPQGQAGDWFKFVNWTDPDFTTIGPLTIVWQP